jgi:hypothetical protein
MVVPRATPVTIPVPPTVATEVLLLTHVPLPELESGVVDPTHTAEDPLMAVGSGNTVTTVVTRHPPPSE